MNIQRFNNDTRAAQAVQAILDLAGQNYEAGLSQLEAVSEAQRSFGADIRIRALANVWEQVEVDYQTSDFAQAVLRVANRYAQAKWWIDRQSHTLGSFNDLDDDIEQELGNA